MSRVRDRQGRVISNVVVGHRICSYCQCWRPITDFPPRKWADENKTKILYVQSDCYACRRIKASVRWRNASPVARKRYRTAARVSKRRARRIAGTKEIGARVTGWSRRGSVRREPFAHWLREKKEEVGVAELSRRIDMNPRQIHTIINGYDRAGRNMSTHRQGKLRQVDFVSFDTVDRSLLNWGEPWVINELYPPEEPDQNQAA